MANKNQTEQSFSSFQTRTALWNATWDMQTCISMEYLSKCHPIKGKSMEEKSFPILFLTYVEVKWK